MATNGNKQKGNKKTTRNIIFAVEIAVIVIMLAVFFIITRTTEKTDGPKRPDNWDKVDLGTNKVTVELEDQVVTILDEWLAKEDVASGLDDESKEVLKDWIGKKKNSKDFEDVELETKDGTFYFFKCDIMRGEVTYSTDKHIPANLVTISGRRAFAIIEMNKRGERPDALQTGGTLEPKRPVDLLEQENINRFDNASKGRRRKGGGAGRGEQKRNNGRRDKGQKDAKKGA